MKAKKTTGSWKAQPMKSTEGPADWGGEKLVRLARILHANPGSPEWHPPLDDLLDLAVSELANPGHVAKLNIHLATCKSVEKRGQRI